MANLAALDRLAVKLTAAFLLAAVLGVALVAVLAYRSTSGEFGSFLRHVEGMDQAMGGGMMGGMGQPVLAAAEGDFREALGRSLWIAGVSGVALALALGGLSARAMVAPLARLTESARRVARGDLELGVEVRGSDELAELGRSFNSMAATLRRDRELRRNMVADIAHELRTPLSILQGNVEAMLDGVLPADRENLASLHQEALLLGRMVEDLRTLSLAEAGQLVLHPLDTDVGELAAGVVEGFHAQAAGGGVRLEVLAPRGVPPARVDPDRTGQVLRNLLSNALRYTPQGGAVTVRVEPGPEGVCVTVEDTGPGIAAKDLPFVFDRFYRVDRSRARSTGGSGLGLAIVKQLVEAQGGTVRVESAPGRGSAFAFTLPRAGA